MSRQPGFVLVIIMSDACGHCVNFKNTQLATLKRRIAKEFDNVKVEEITLPTFSSDLPEKYPPSLKNLISWFPMFMLCDGENWSSACNNKKNLSKFIVFNGEMSNGKPQIKSKYALNAENILKWMETGN